MTDIDAVFDPIDDFIHTLEGKRQEFLICTRLTDKKELLDGLVAAILDADKRIKEMRRFRMELENEILEDMRN